LTPYLACNDDSIVRQLSTLLNNRSEDSIVINANSRARRTWDGEYFAVGWPSLLLPEWEFHPQWLETHNYTIQEQKNFGQQHCNGHYGFSAGLGPDNKYYEYRIPQMGEQKDLYIPHTVITISALLNMGVLDPIGTYHKLQCLHEQFPRLRHALYGDGDTVNVITAEIQRDQLLLSQAVSLLSCWNILSNRKVQGMFM
jgi:hypothetical protein